MTQHGWNDCPAPIRAQVNGLLDGFRQLLGNNLVGVYLHGSLATGCHNPERSDIDLLLIIQQGMTVETKRALAELVFRYERQPRQLELSALTLEQLHPWQYPTPFDFHNGDGMVDDLASGAWQQWNDITRTDPDLAAHITVINHRGLCLFGKPIADVFPAVPPENYRESILLDFDWGLERIDQNPVYFILNACRIAAYLQEGLVLSKAEGGEWGLKRAPKELHGIITQALDIYRGDVTGSAFDPSSLARFVAFVRELIR